MYNGPVEFAMADNDYRDKAPQDEGKRPAWRSRINAYKRRIYVELAGIGSSVPYRDLHRTTNRKPVEAVNAVTNEVSVFDPVSGAAQEMRA